MLILSGIILATAGLMCLRLMMIEAIIIECRRLRIPCQIDKTEAMLKFWRSIDSFI